MTACRNSHDEDETCADCESQRSGAVVSRDRGKEHIARIREQMHAEPERNP